MDIVKFFGTTGDKDLMFDNRLLPGGLYLEIDNYKIVMDPGPGTFNNFVKAFPGQITELDALILSHVHFDHSTDINVMIEGMTDGGKQKRGMLITSDFAFNGESRVINNYLKSFMKTVWLVNEQPSNELGELLIDTVEHQHGIPNYGFIFSYNRKKISVVTDTRFFDEIVDFYKGSTTMILNVPYESFPIGKSPKHLCIEDAKRIIKQIAPKRVILTHFGESMFNSGIDSVTKKLGEELGVEILAAHSNQEYSLL
jgi:ribonuclease BN (tRNA processing enzyme)